MGPPPKTPECLTCGACCFSELPTYVRVRGADYERLGDDAERLTFFEHNRCYLRMDGGRCAALTVQTSGRFVCSVYERRPAICRDLKRGGAACQAELDAKYDRTRLALRVLRH